METSKKTARRKIIKYSVLIGIVLISIFSIYFYFKFYYTYSDGYRSGVLQKISHKGTIFKTYEGELLLSNITRTSTERFLFSITDEAVVKELEKLDGMNVTLHYNQKNNPLFWRGESAYIVVGVEKK